MNKCDFRSQLWLWSMVMVTGTSHAALEYYGYGQKNKPAQVEHSPEGLGDGTAACDRLGS